MKAQDRGWAGINSSEPGVGVGVLETCDVVVVSALDELPNGSHIDQHGQEFVEVNAGLATNARTLEILFKFIDRELWREVLQTCDERGMRARVLRAIRARDSIDDAALV